MRAPRVIVGDDEHPFVLDRTEVDDILHALDVSMKEGTRTDAIRSRLKKLAVRIHQEWSNRK